MARIIGDKRLNARLSRMARGQDVTSVLVKGAEQTRQAYIEAVQEPSPGTPDVRYSPRRNVMVSAPGTSPNADTGYLVNSTGVASEHRNQAETFASASYAEDLEFGTDKMAPRPAMGPAFDETKQQVLSDLARALKQGLRNA